MISLPSKPNTWSSTLPVSKRLKKIFCPNCSARFHCLCHDSFRGFQCFVVFHFKRVDVIFFVSLTLSLLEQIKRMCNNLWIFILAVMVTNGNGSKPTTTDQRKEVVSSSEVTFDWIKFYEKYTYEEVVEKRNSYKLLELRDYEEIQFLR